MNIIFYFHIISFIFVHIKSGKLESINSNRTQIIVQQNKLFYIKNDENKIYVHNLGDYTDDSVSISDITKNKIIISLNEEKFILFGYANANANGNSNFLFKIYNSNNYENSTEEGSFGQIIYHEKINIKMVNETLFLLYFFREKEKSMNIYKLNINNRNHYFINKKISNYPDYNLNTIECDSFDGEQILCVYSLLSETNIKFQYFYDNFQDGSISEKEISDIYKDLKAVSFNKIIINNQKIFIMCFISTMANSENQQLYCQTLTENNQLYIDEIYLIEDIIEKKTAFVGQSNYIYNTPIKIVINNYSIYVLIELVSPKGKGFTLYTISLNFGLWMSFDSDAEIDLSSSFTSSYILINPVNNNLILYEKFNSNETKIHYKDFEINCKNFEKQFNKDNKNNKDGIPLNDNLEINKTLDKYIAFSLDKVVYLEDENHNRISSGLTAKKEIKEESGFNLIYSNNLKITENYYFYLKKSDNPDFENDIPASPFCYFKVINCQDNCSVCHSNIVGTSEIHQCKNCNSDFYKYNNGKNDKGYYNCYQLNDPNVPKNMFLNITEGEFFQCDESCKECFSTKDCKSCNIGYFFIYNEKTKNITNDHKCVDEAPENYYLNLSSNISFNNEIVKFIYKPCYHTCRECFGDGNFINNNCINCRNGYTTYPFDSRQCLIDKKNCSTYWSYNTETKNITCIEKCNDYAIKNTTNNFNHCVKDCRSFFDPYSEFLSLLSFNCGGEKVCITIEECNRRGLKNANGECLPDGNSCFFVPRTTIIITTPTPPTESPTQAKTEAPTEAKTEAPTEPPKKIENRVRFIKTFEIDKQYSELKNNFKEIQFKNYKEELQKELYFGIYVNGIDFITFSKYRDFNITIYPLEAEQYVKDNLFDINNLISINFTKFFENYEKDEDYQILVALIEHKNDNLPINSMNYFFILFNENNKDYKFIDNLNFEDSLIDISYPLFNYKHENISAKYSTELISTIKELNNIDENFNFFDHSNSFYNDICYTDTFGKDIDMAIKDRMAEYYVEISFCENECTFKNIYDKDKNPKSLCECKLKESLNIGETNYSFNTTTKEAESVSNLNALTCFTEVFASGKLSSNPAFWIFLVMLFVVAALFISIIFCAKSAIANMLKMKKEDEINSDINNIEEINTNNINNNKGENNNNDKKLDKLNEDDMNSNKSKSMKISNNDKPSSNNAEEKESNDFNISKKESSESNPPKKAPSKSKETTDNKISYKENETSLFQSELNYNLDKDSGFEDIFDDIGGVAPKVNNFIQNEKNYKKDNYIYLEKRKLIGKLMKSLPPLDKKEFNKYKYINTVNENNDIKQNRNIILTGVDANKKEHYSMDDIKNPKNLNLINYSDIKNKGQKISKYSKLFGEESILSGNEKFIQAGKILDKNNNKEGDNYEKDIKENNNKNNSSNNFNISEKKELEDDLRVNNLYKKKKKALGNSLNENSENRKLKNSLNSSVNSNNKLLFKKNTKNQQDEQNQNSKNQLRSQEEKEIIYKKSSLISVTESEIDNNLIIAKRNNNLCYFYSDYFVKREIFLCTFYHKQDTVSIFIRLPTFFVVIGFVFMINCLFLTENDIHERYEYYNEHGKMNEFKYAFTHDLGKCLIIALINIVYKMICIKLVYFIIFKISPKIKEEISEEKKNMSQLELKEINSKKKKYLKKYKIRSIIFMIIILILLLVFAYVSIFYIGIFRHSFINVLINSVISIIFSFIFCAFLCFIISIFFIGRCRAIFNVLKIIY